MTNKGNWWRALLGARLLLRYARAHFPLMCPEHCHRGQQGCPSSASAPRRLTKGNSHPYRLKPHSRALLSRSCTATGLTQSRRVVSHTHLKTWQRHVSMNRVPGKGRTAWSRKKGSTLLPEQPNEGGHDGSAPHLLSCEDGCKQALLL